MPLVDIVMPQLGTSVVEGTVLEWLVEVGSPVSAEATICEISTDKVDSECPAPVAGTVAEILVEVGETVEVGTVLGRISSGDEQAEEADDDGAPAAPPPQPPSGPRQPASPRSRADGVRSSPVARRIAAEHGLDLTAVAGSGRGGRVTKKDVLAAVESCGDAGERPLHSDSPYRPDDAPAPAPPRPASPPVAPPAGGEPQQLSRMRQLIGAAMLGSQQTTATCHTLVECDMTRIEARRAELGLTALPLVAAAVVETLAEFPDLNATLEGTTITRFGPVNLGIAVSLGDEGLIVPVVRDAQNLSPAGLGERIRDLAKRARERRLEPDEVQGATFTITNPGAFGAVLATPVIDVPQVAILDLEAIVRRPVVVSDADGNESIAIRSMVNLILGWDHRAIDGVYAARFLTSLRGRLEGL